MFGWSDSPSINSYYASIGTTTYIDADCVNPGDTTGVFGYRVAYGLRDISDGPSNTIAFSESLCSPGQSTATRGRLIMGAGFTADEVYDRQEGVLTAARASMAVARLSAPTNSARGLCIGLRVS